MMAQIDKLTAVMKTVGDAHGISVAQVGTAWAIAKGTLPIIGVTKVKHVEDAAQVTTTVLIENEMTMLEKVADELGLSTIRYWEKKME